MGTIRELGLGHDSGSATLTGDERVKRVNARPYKSISYNFNDVTIFSLQASDIIDFEKVHIRPSWRIRELDC